MIASILIFAGFVTYVILRYGMENSISQQYYNLKPLWERLLFSLFCFGIATPPLVVWFNSVPMDWRFLFPFLGSFGIMVVGMSPAFRLNKLINALHLYGSYTGIGLWLIGLWLYGIQYPGFVFGATVLFLFIAMKQGKLNLSNGKTSFTTWVEIAGYVTISAGIILR